MNPKNSFTEEDMKAFEPAEKIGIVASISPQGFAHITLITSIRANGPARLTLGEFCKGLSKQHIQNNPQIGFLVLTLDKKMWRGKAKWTHLRKEGPEYEKYNQIPMFRYNTYFGINTVHYLDLIETAGKEKLPMARIIPAALLTKLAKGGAKSGNQDPILKPFAEKLFNKLDSLKFIAYVGNDGFPVIIPLIQCQAADSRRLAFSPLAFSKELKDIPKGTEVAVFGITMNMEDVLVRGIFQGFHRIRFLRLGTIDIGWVYNSMPPAHGQIYPEVELKPVVNF
ncbi:MAG: pyridoxamine 5'-phosphate oxidase family protein [Desulfobacterales bacterium]|nr:MAG: pyridoxamine 5'-phosphate oxidase family protein [Desulfobacterales bacterium]